MAYSLVNPRELGFLRQIERVTKSKITKKDIPSVEDIFKTKNETFKEKIVTELSSNNYKKFYPIIEEMKETFNVDDVAAALMQMLYKEELSFDYKVNMIETPKRFVRLFVTVGSMDKLTPKKMIDFIVAGTNLKADSIGTIDVLTKFSFVDVIAGTEDEIVNKLNGQKLSGRKAKFEVAARRRR
jgi:ATP-dependent RNA helicase DeaD